jgi:anti-sigma28 factor (negative regulator of flagellin synthesis)
MAINPVNRNNAAQNINGTSAKRPVSARTDEAPAKRGDSLELSSEVRSLRESGDVQSIKSKITNGFYNRPDVIAQTAEKISQALPPGSEE